MIFPARRPQAVTYFTASPTPEWRVIPPCCPDIEIIVYVFPNVGKNVSWCFSLSGEWGLTVYCRTTLIQSVHSHGLFRVSYQVLWSVSLPPHVAPLLQLIWSNILSDSLISVSFVMSARDSFLCVFLCGTRPDKVKRWSPCFWCGSKLGLGHWSTFIPSYNFGFRPLWKQHNRDETFVVLYCVLRRCYRFVLLCSFAHS